MGRERGRERGREKGGSACGRSCSGRARPARLRGGWRRRWRPGPWTAEGWQSSWDCSGGGDGTRAWVPGTRQVRGQLRGWVDRARRATFQRCSDTRERVEGRGSGGGRGWRQRARQRQRQRQRQSAGAGQEQLFQRAVSQMRARSGERARVQQQGGQGGAHAQGRRCSDGGHTAGTRRAAPAPAPAAKCCAGLAEARRLLAAFP